MRKPLIALALLSALTVQAEARPRAWCGWYMRTQFGGGEQLNLARNWAHFGTNAGRPAQGVIVVFNHHVGVITGQDEYGNWIVLSGNDGGRVRERPRSLRGAIAFRWPSYRVAWR